MQEPDPNQVPTEVFPDPAGSALKGALLNIGLNAFICLIWLPLCAGNSGSGGDSVAAYIGIIFFFGMVYLGVTQLIHVIPLSIYLLVKQQSKTNKGMWIAAGITFVVWGIIALIIIGQ